LIPARRDAGRQARRQAGNDLARYRLGCLILNIPDLFQEAQSQNTDLYLIVYSTISGYFIKGTRAHTHHTHIHLADPTPYRPYLSSYGRLSRQKIGLNYSAEIFMYTHL
jgi:hypothetical protein